MIKKQDKFKRNELLNTNSWIWIFPTILIVFWITSYLNLGGLTLLLHRIL